MKSGGAQRSGTENVSNTLMKQELKSPFDPSGRFFSNIRGLQACRGNFTFGPIDPQMVSNFLLTSEHQQREEEAGEEEHQESNFLLTHNPPPALPPSSSSFLRVSKGEDEEKTETQEKK